MDRCRCRRSPAHPCLLRNTARPRGTRTSFPIRPRSSPALEAWPLTRAAFAEMADRVALEVAAAGHLGRLLVSLRDRFDGWSRPDRNRFARRRGRQLPDAAEFARAVVDRSFAGCGGVIVPNAPAAQTLVMLPSTSAALLTSARQSPTELASQDSFLDPAAVTRIRQFGRAWPSLTARATAGLDSRKLEPNKSCSSPTGSRRACFFKAVRPAAIRRSTAIHAPATLLAVRHFVRPNRDGANATHRSQNGSRKLFLIIGTL